MNRTRVVTIDGPAGSGKSTVAAQLAQSLGWTFLDTGAMYRALALAALRAGVPVSDGPALAELASSLRIDLGPGRVLLEGIDVSALIRTPEISGLSSQVAAHEPVRAHMVACQRSMGAHSPCVTEGRDQGTVVFPHALLKVFLTASPDERALRRHAQRLQASPSSAAGSSCEAILAEQSERDRRDAGRASGPMRAADDAVIFDTTGIGLPQVIELLQALVRTGPPFPWQPEWSAATDPVPPCLTAFCQAWLGDGSRLLALGREPADATRWVEGRPVRVVSPATQAR